MFVNTRFRRFLFNLVFLLIGFIINFILFYDIFSSKSVIISFAVHPFDICKTYPKIWLNIKFLYVLSSILCYLICINTLYSSMFTRKLEKSISSYISPSGLNLKIFNTSNKNLIIPENRFISKFSNNWNYWFWQNKFYNVSFH